MVSTLIFRQWMLIGRKSEVPNDEHTAVPEASHEVPVVVVPENSAPLRFVV
jgi:hypothetical protein